ncbi:MAG: permease-like cell division protein FtsX [Oscillospiraceae bacterium]|nr:permease-like cell division protein FtsX [Oscillospiraceae bacterium]
MKLNRFFYLIKEGIKSIFTHGFMSFASVTIIVACLIIMGSFSLLSFNIDSMISDMEQDNEILAFVEDELSDEEAMAIGTRLEAVSNVSSVTFVTRQEAFESFKAEYDDDTRFDDLPDTTLRHRYVIHLEDLSLVETTAQDIKAINGIADVGAELEISRAIITIRNIISLVSFVIIAILFVVSVFIMNNTIKLATYSRKEEIAIMKMVGASNAFIRFPFVVEGMILGLLGGGVAFFIEWGLYSLLTEKLMATIIGGIVNVVAFEILLIPMLAIFLGIGLLVGVFGSSVAIRNYLKI